MKKNILSLCLCTVLFAFALTACGSTNKTITLQEAKTYTTPNATTATWSVYWYLCGSDLESQDGAATADLNELKKVTLPANVRIIIQTGGASHWKTKQIKANKIQRFEYKGNQLKLLDELPQANMGASSTFTDFLSFCNKSDQSDHKMLLFWNHGGGSVAGAESDENFDGDSLTLTEMKSSLSSVYQSSKPFELVGFDTCLMATLETANLFKDYSRYLVASEETEPGNGWLYSDWVGSLTKDTSMDGAKLGRIICDTFKKGCINEGTEDTITLSVTDLSKIPALTAAFNQMGTEILQTAYATQDTCGKFARSAIQSENYGGNNKSDGFTNMVDLGDLVENTKSILPKTADIVSAALKDAVIYKIDSKYRKKSNGLAIYYSLNSDKEELAEYNKISTAKSYSYFLDYSIGNALPKDAAQIANTTTSDTEQVEGFDGNIHLSLDKDGYVTFHLKPKFLATVKEITANLTYYDENDDTYVCLGYDNDLNADYTTGNFQDNFQGVWAGLDGNLAFLQLSYSDDQYNLYAVPIMLNGEECTMEVAYDFDTQLYTILGAKKGLDAETGMADKNLLAIVPGDKIAMVLYAGRLSEEKEPEAMPMDEFTFTNKMKFESMDLPDGDYDMYFEVEDTTGNFYTSSMAYMSWKKGNITAELE